MEVQKIIIQTHWEMCTNAETFFLRHGCQITIHKKHREVTYPDGTTRQEYYFRAPFTTRYLITFPDGITTWEYYHHHLRLSVLYYPKK